MDCCGARVYTAQVQTGTNDARVGTHEEERRRRRRRRREGGGRKWWERTRLCHTQHIHTHTHTVAVSPATTHVKKNPYSNRTTKTPSLQEPCLPILFWDIGLLLIGNFWSLLIECWSLWIGQWASFNREKNAFSPRALFFLSKSPVFQHKKRLLSSSFPSRLVLRTKEAHCPMKRALYS